MNWRNIIKTILVLLLVPTFTICAKGGSKFSIKISGGMNYLTNGGDMKDWFGSEKSYYQWLGTQPNYSVSSNWEFGNSVIDLNFEGLYQISYKLGIGMGVGYLKKSWNPNSNITYDYGESSGTDNLIYSIKSDAKIIPLTLSLYYSILQKKGFAVNLTAGLGYYLGVMKFEEESNYTFPSQNDFKCNYEAYTETKSNKIGFHIGWGIEKSISSRISLSIDVIYRKVRFDELKGDRVWKESVTEAGTSNETSGKDTNQTLWYGSYQWQGNSYKRAVFDGSKPDWMNNAQPFKFGLDGLLLKGSIKIRF
jgi:hypothetical protein